MRVVFRRFRLFLLNPVISLVFALVFVQIGEERLSVFVLGTDVVVVVVVVVVMI